MAGKLDIYQLGLGGINIVKQSLQPADDELLQSQNAEVKLDTELGGIATLSKRDGLADLGDTLGSSIAEMAEVRFINEDDLGGGATETFRPISDVENSGDDGWTTAPLFSKLDEVTPDDLDFVTTFAQSAILSNFFVLGLTTVVNTSAATAGTCKIRIKITDNGGGMASVPAGDTLFSFSLRTSAPLTLGTANILRSQVSSTFATLTFDLASDMGYSGSSFDWSILETSLNCPGSAFLTPGIDTVEVSWIEITLTHS
jgi:hypothetical protein